MRVAIREQLTLLIILAALIGLAVVSIPTWIYVTRFVLGVRRDGLSLTASLKASRITAELELLQQSCATISSRILVQRALVLFYNNGDDDAAWEDASLDIYSALSASSLAGLLQARIYSRNITGGAAPLLGVTSTAFSDIQLPYAADDGSAVFLSNSSNGYPYSLYPNMTYIDLDRPNSARPETQAFAAEAFEGVRVAAGQGLLLGPLIINSTFALVSLTIPIRDNDDSRFILGYMTVVATASSLFQIRDSREGLGDTGMVLVVGPTTPWNRFEASLPPSNDTFVPDRDAFGRLSAHYVVPVSPPAGQEYRHEAANMDTDTDAEDPFLVRDYPAVLSSFADQPVTVNGRDAYVSTTNELGVRVAAGWARTSTPLVNWTIVVEQARDEAYAPITTLRKILLGTVFGTLGLLILIVFPCAHLSVMPIRRLKDATEKTIQPPGYEEQEYSSDLDDDDDGEGTPTSGNVSSRSHRSEKGLMASVKKFINRRTRGRPSSDNGRETTRRIFKIPGKVEDKPHLITDELTELTRTFNDMSDELVRQVSSLDQKVADRTKELEISKKAAEAANESKTLFIANISHELKTPLNGILGMCAVCMEETDLGRIKHSLKTLYKSGDLLLHLLEDLLSFSKNQIGQQLALEEKEFRLADIRAQILAIFEKQVREGDIKFSVVFGGGGTLEGGDLEKTDRMADEKTSEKMGTEKMVSEKSVRLKDMCLWGDQHRVLQVIINLVSNSLKFTPPGGSVAVRIKCLEEITPDDDASKPASFSSPRSSTARGGRSRNRVGSSSSGSTNSRATTTASTAPKNYTGTALSINPMDPSPSHKYKKSHPPNIRDRSPSPPPPNARLFMFEFEVEDTGPGIPEYMQQRVFEPFVQGDPGLSKKFGGTGLGLSICHQLASLMGGSIKLRSTLGAGSTFTMRIPLRYVKDRPSSTASSSCKSRSASVDDDNRKPQPQQPHDASPTSSKTSLEHQPRLVGLRQPFFASGMSPKPTNKTDKQMAAALENAVAKKKGPGKLRVLVADDNSTNVEVVSRMLKLEDVVDVTIAKDGQEAYDKVKWAMEHRQRFDLIFMDIQMPNLDGLQSTRLIRQMGYTLPIVALTAFSEESNVKECMESGMDEFLSKPIRRPALKKVLQKFATIPEEEENVNQVQGKGQDRGQNRGQDGIQAQEKGPTGVQAQDTTEQNTGKDGGQVRDCELDGVQGQAEVQGQGQQQPPTPPAAANDAAQIHGPMKPADPAPLHTPIETPAEAHKELGHQ